MAEFQPYTGAGGGEGGRTAVNVAIKPGPERADDRKTVRKLPVELKVFPVPLEPRSLASCGPFFPSWRLTKSEVLKEVNRSLTM